LEDVAESKSVSRFVDLLDNQIKMRLKNINEIDSDDNLAAASNKHDEKQLLVNARSIGLTWLILKGLVDIDKVIDYLIERNSHDNEATSIELTKLGLFVVESALPKRDHKVFSLVKLLKVQQAKLQTSLNLETSQREQLEKELNTEQKKYAAQKNENTALNKKVSALEASLAELNQTLDQQQALGKAERVHLKDDHGKAKYKTLNTLEEDVIPLLEKTCHALNKDVPKVHIATHQLELVTEEIEGLIKWLKK
jgi:chromosome segregation ATPase